MLDHIAKANRGRVEKPAPVKPEYDEALKEECREYIDEEFIEAGGDYREDQRGTVYWLDLPHLLEFERADKEIPDDREFWSWFKEYRSKHDLKAKRSKVRWDSYWDGQQPKQHRDYFTGWWKGYNDQAGAFGGNSAKLAIALGAVQSIVSVVNDTGQMFRVKLADGDKREAPTSVTSFDTKMVIVSPQALLDTSIDQDKGIRVTAGWGLHEASHVRWTAKVWPVLVEPTILRPMAIAGQLFNLMEDVRIEEKTSILFPGFRHYFDEAGTYLWDVTKKFAPTQWGPELGDKLNCITAIVKWPNEFQPIVEKSKDQRLKDEYEWFKAWTDKYRTDDSNPRAMLIEALLHLKEDEETRKQLQEQEQQERAEGSPRALSEGEFKDLLKKLRHQMKGGRPIESCPSPTRGGKPIELSPEQGRQVEKLIREGLEVREPVVKMGNKMDEGRGPKVASYKPEETVLSRRAYRKPGPLVARLKAAFVFRKTAPSWAEKLQRSGALDEDQLWRLAEWDFKVFERKIEPQETNTSVTLLVDMSGSMNGNRVETAQMLANTMLECLKTMKGVKVRVRGHTTPNGEVVGGEALIYRIWEPGDPVTRIGLISTCPKGWNYDGFAIDWCARELVETSQQGEDKVIVILSDGKPNALGFAYTGPPAMDHVRKVTEEWARKGVTTFQIAIDPEMRTKDQARMYRHWIQYGDDLPQKLTRLLIKLFGGAAA